VPVVVGSPELGVLEAPPSSLPLVSPAFVSPFACDPSGARHAAIARKLEKNVLERKINGWLRHARTGEFATENGMSNHVSPRRNPGKLFLLA
jgi:hypothetical protein